jgi:hypothetical protein
MPAASGAGAGAARRAGHPPPSSPVVLGLVEARSGGELELLWLLAVGKPNREIAEELRVALDRVKKHATHILDKLGAATAPRQPAAPASSACPLRVAEPPAQPPVSYRLLPPAGPLDPGLVIGRLVGLAAAVTA